MNAFASYNTHLRDDMLQCCIEIMKTLFSHQGNESAPDPFVGTHWYSSIAGVLGSEAE